LQGLYEKGGELGLQEISRRRAVLKNRTAPEIEAAVVESAIEQQTHLSGRQRAGRWENLMCGATLTICRYRIG